MTDETIAVRLIVTGKVQGVGYRYWATGAARRHGVRGWVRNLPDGSVEILAIGAGEGIEILIKACDTGPLMAAVTAVIRHPAEDDGSTDFRQRPTPTVS